MRCSTRLLYGAPRYLYTVYCRRATVARAANLLPLTTAYRATPDACVYACCRWVRLNTYVLLPSTGSCTAQVRDIPAPRRARLLLAPATGPARRAHGCLSTHCLGDLLPCHTTRLYHLPTRPLPLLPAPIRLRYRANTSCWCPSLLPNILVTPARSRAVARLSLCLRLRHASTACSYRFAGQPGV